MLARYPMLLALVASTNVRWRVERWSRAAQASKTPDSGANSHKRPGDDPEAKAAKHGQVARWVVERARGVPAYHEEDRHERDET